MWSFVKLGEKRKKEDFLAFLDILFHIYKVFFLKKVRHKLTMKSKEIIDKINHFEKVHLTLHEETIIIE